MERSLDELGVRTSCLGTVHACPLTEVALGKGAVAVAVVPSSAYWRDEATLRGLGSRNAVSEGIEQQNRRIT